MKIPRVIGEAGRPACRYSDRGVQWALFLLFLSLYTLTMSGRISSPDGEVVFRTGQSLAERGRWDVEPLKEWRGFGISQGTSGRQYSLFGPGQSVAMIPFYELGRFMYRVHPSAFSFLLRRPFLAGYHTKNGFEETVRMFSVWLNVWVSALACVVLFRIARALDGSPVASMGVALLYGVGTNAWACSRYCFSEPLAILLILLSFEQLVRACLMGRDRDAIDPHPDPPPLSQGRDPFSLPQVDSLPCESGGGSGWGPRRCRHAPRHARHLPGRPALFAAGLFLGLSVLTHISMLVCVPFFAWYAWKVCEDAPRSRSFDAAAFLTPLVAVACLLFWYNYARFGNPLESGRMGRYGHLVAPWVGLVGLLVSPGKGILWNNPLVWASVFSVRSFLGRWPREGWLIGGMCLTRLLLVASRTDWHGGFCIGPRLLAPLLPFLTLLLLENLQRAESKQLPRVGERLLAACATVSFFVQMLLVKCSIFDWLFWKREQLLHLGFTDSVIYNRLFHFSPDCSPLVGFLYFPPTDMLALDGFRYGAGVAFRWVLLFTIVLLAVALARLRAQITGKDQTEAPRSANRNANSPEGGST